MANIIVAFSKPEDGKSIKGILVRSGYEVAAVCMSGSQVLSAAEDLSGGIVVCGYRFEDMMYDELRQCLSFNFEMLVLASPARWSGIQMSGVVCLPMPPWTTVIVRVLAARMALMLWQARSACSSMVVPTISPVPGIRGTWPEANRKPLAEIA